MKLSIRFAFGLAALLSATDIFAAQTNVLLSITAPWRYNTNNLDGTNWQATTYNDSAWSGPGNALLYIETASLPAAKNTALPPKPGGSLPYNNYYFRSSFVVSNVSEITLLVFSNLVDDGAVYYLNGTEVQRLYMPSGPIVYTNFSSSSHNGTSYDVFSLAGDTLTNLLEGTNVLAAEVHQTSATSTDIVFGTAVASVRGGTASLTRGPYLQLGTPTSIVIRWRTDAGANSRIVYGTNLAALNITNDNLSSVSEHIITLTNLPPDTKYFYSVGSTSNTLAGPDANHYFCTHPLPGSTKPLRVWVIGDAGTKDANQIAVRNSFQNYNGTNIIHGWLQLGDNAYDAGTDAEYQLAVFNVYTNQLRNSVTWPTLGNHDTDGSTTFVDTYPYFSMFTLPTAAEAGGVPSGTEHYYSFDLGMVHFICLDSMTASRATNGAMATWLRSDIATTTNRWIIAFWHHPPYSKGSHDSDPGGPGYNTQMGEMRANFLPILEAGGVDLVLAGHSHVYERSYFINGHYGISGTFSVATNIIQPGSGRETNGVGAYRKPDGLGEKPIGQRGTIYAVAGSSGQTDGITLNHPAMFYSTNALGSMVLDFRSNRLDAIFLRETNTIINDTFTIIKDGTHPPKLTDHALAPDGQFQFTVLGRAYRTNIVEASTNLANWSPLLTNYSTNAHFGFSNNITGDDQRFFRARRVKSQ